MNTKKYAWQFETEPEPYLDNRRMHCPRGNVLGGSSSINGMVYVRGHARDFDEWETEGARGWGYQSVLPYFKKAEQWAFGGDDYRGESGPLGVNNGNNMRNPLYKAFIKAGVDAGYLETDDYNGARQEGFGAMHMTVKNGRRWSTANAYLRPAMDRPNLTVVTHALVQFFEIPVVKVINNAVIIGTCAFTAYLLLANLPWYLPQLGDGESVVPAFYAIVFASIGLAVYSSSKIKYVRILSLGSSLLFILLIAGMWMRAFVLGKGSPADFFGTAGLIGEYFANLHRFFLPINDYHEFYLFWWFSWSIMIGQFTARFVSGIKTWQLLIAMLVVPSIAIGVWFTVLYHYHAEGLKIATFTNLAMISVGVLMVVNSLDSLIRLYTDNLNLTAKRLGRVKYVVLNLVLMVGLTLLFQLDFLRIQWVGALVIGLYFTCFGYILIKRRKQVAAIKSSPKENILDFRRIELAG